MSGPSLEARPAAGAAPGYLAVAGAAALWGLSGALARYLFRQQVDALLLVNLRMTFSFVLLLGALALVRRDLVLPPRATWAPVAVWALLGMAPVQFTYLYAIQETNVATAIFLQYLAPVLTALHTRTVRRQVLGARLVGALAVAVAGSALLVLGGAQGLRLAPSGVAAGLASAGFFAFYTIYGGTLVGRVNAWTLLLWGLGLGALTWNLLLPPWVALARVDTPAMWGFFLYIAVFATIVPFGLFLWGLRRVAPTPAGLTAMLEPVVGAAAAWVALGEALAWAQTLGALLILGAVAAIQVGSGKGGQAGG